MEIFNTINLTHKSDVKKLLGKYGAKPEKYLGQHFILSRKALALMVGAAETQKNDAIIEIGSGLGTLTRELATVGAKIIAIEKDPLMIKILKETLADYKNVKIIQADAKKISLPISDVGCRAKSGKIVHRYKIVANLPYNAATFLIRQWLESNPPVGGPPELMVLMIQKEVAQRIVARPPHSNLLGISVQFYADVKIIDYIKKESFWPKPKVDAAIIKIVPKKKPPQKTRNAFFAGVKAGFSQPRKQLAGNLSKKLGIPKEKVILTFKDLGISTTVRAEKLSLNQWQNLALRVIHN